MEQQSRLQERDNPMATNTYRVSSKSWKQWSPQAKAVFNSVFGYMRDNQENFLHPKAPALPAIQWRTTAWNAAWIAADAVDEVETKVV